MKIDKVKVSELPEIEDVTNFDALGVDRQTNRSVKMGAVKIMMHKQDKLTAGNSIEINDNVISIKDTGWVNIAHIDPRIGLEVGGAIQYRRIGDVIYFKYSEGGVFLINGGGSVVYPLISIETLGLTEQEVRDGTSTQLNTDGVVCYLEYSYDHKAYSFNAYDRSNIEVLLYTTTSIILG